MGAQTTINLKWQRKGSDGGGDDDGGCGSGWGGSEVNHMRENVTLRFFFLYAT